MKKFVCIVTKKAGKNTVLIGFKAHILNSGYTFGYVSKAGVEELAGSLEPKTIFTVEAAGIELEQAVNVETGELLVHADGSPVNVLKFL